MVSTTGDKTFHVDRYLAGRDDHTEEGISELHSQFDPSEYGYMPFNEQFSNAPGEHGYQPLNEQFSFDADDLYKDPGYQFRLEQGNKGIERKAASRGFLAEWPDAEEPGPAFSRLSISGVWGRLWAAVTWRVWDGPRPVAGCL